MVVRLYFFGVVFFVVFVILVFGSFIIVFVNVMVLRFVIL